MKIRFADQRPEGEYALVLPVAGKDMKNLGSLGGGKDAVEAALKLQRFEGEAASSAEAFVQDGGHRRVLVVGTGDGAKAADAAEKLGGTAVARLLVSGEKHAVIDLSGLAYDADSAAKVALADEKAIDSAIAKNCDPVVAIDHGPVRTCLESTGLSGLALKCWWMVLGGM